WDVVCVFFQAEDGIRDFHVTGVQTCALPIFIEGNQRLFSFNDVDRLLEIKALMEKGVNIAGVKEVLSRPKAPLSEPVQPLAESESRRDLSEEELHRLLKRQLNELPVRPGQQHLIQGELSRFFH